MSKPTSVRLPDKLFASLSAEARRKGVPLPAYQRFCMERGLYADTIAQSCMRESTVMAIYETRNLLRRLVASRSEKDAHEARLEAERQAKEERS